MSLTLALLCALSAAPKDFGTFQTIAGSVVDGPFEVISTDLDLDGDLDLLVGSLEGHGLQWMPNLGGGSFGEALAIGPAVNDCSSVHVGDLDADGDDDILVTAFGDNSVRWIETLGNGQFGAPRTIGSGQFNDPNDAAIADVDGDGALDVIVMSRGNLAHWVRNTGQGTFEANIRLIRDLVESGLGLVHAADFDGDGDMDLVVAPGQSSIVCYLTNVAGGQSWGYQWRSVGGFYFHTAMTSCDLDANGYADLAIASLSGGGLSKVLCIKDLALGSSTPFVELTALPRYVYGLDVEDVDGDGLGDILLGGESAELRLNQSGLNFGPPIPLHSFSAIGGSATLVDVTGDGELDAIASARAESELIVMPSLGGASFGPGMDVLDSGLENPAGLTAVDVDRDGDLDVVSAVEGSGQLILMENSGWGSQFGVSVIATGLSGVSLVSASDVDGDGDEDLVAAGSQNAWVLISDGTGGFGAPIPVLQTAHPITGLQMADLNGDSIADLLYSVRDASRLAVLPGLGGTTFGSVQIISDSVRGAMEVATSDLDLDGDQDVLVATSNTIEGGIDRFENQGAWNFGSPERIIGGGGSILEDASHVKVSDLDGDGLPDVVASGRDAHLKCALNQGSGQFPSDRWIFGVSNHRSRNVEVGDVNGDGLPDLVTHQVESWTPVDVQVRLGIGSGQFGPWTVVTDRPDRVVAILTADLDGDGDDDVLTSSMDDDKVGWCNALGVPAGGIGTPYCGPGVANSTGLTGECSLSGSSISQLNQLTAVATHIPPSSLGYFIASQSSGFVTNPGGSQGHLCLGGTIARFIDSAQQAGTDMEIRHPLDLMNVPLGSGVQVAPGESWRFQLWYRDANPQLTSNFTIGVELTFQ